MSRLPRAQELLKTGFTAEAASAARLRATAASAEAGGKPNLTRALRELASEKDALAYSQLGAVGPSRSVEEELAAALAEERYENDALYPRMAGEVDAATAAIFQGVVAKQQAHAAKLESLLDQLSRSGGDLPA